MSDHGLGVHFSDDEDVFSPGPVPHFELSRLEMWSTFALLDLHVEPEEISLGEFSNELAMLWQRGDNNTALRNLRAAGTNMLLQNWSFEHLVVLAIAITSTTLCFYSPQIEGFQGAAFNAKLDFHFLFTSFMYLFTFLTRNTFSRREVSATHISKIKALACQIQLGLLIWNRKKLRPSNEFEDEVCSVMVELVQCFFRVLGMPTQLDEFGRSGNRRALRTRTQQLRGELMKRMCALHYALEECKQSDTLGSSESNRLADYAKTLHIEMERVQLLKQYRTPQSAREFVTAHLFICPIFWGLYFANIGVERAGYVFAILLCAVSVFIAHLLTHMMRAMEDPFVPDRHRENIQVQRELKDTVDRLRMVRKFSAMKRHFRPAL
ncbi:hypothetical protein BASA81_001426 [Batrachochytrium salamandrivorans]|nr:hypothetical protein BASA81_001426 [Batrachochytrium salamandrivorans]